MKCYCCSIILINDITIIDYCVYYNCRCCHFVSLVPTHTLFVVRTYSFVVSLFLVLLCIHLFVGYNGGKYCWVNVRVTMLWSVCSDLTWLIYFHSGLATKTNKQTLNTKLALILKTRLVGWHFPFRRWVIISCHVDWVHVNDHVLWRHVRQCTAKTRSCGRKHVS